VEVERVAAICGHLHRAYRDLRFYPHNHPVPRKTVCELGESLQRFVAEEGELKLEVEEDRLIFAEESVYAHAETRDNLAFIMFRDGVRAVSFHSGLETEEIEALVGCLARADELLASDQDLLTAFWEEDFAHIDYLAADPFVGGGVLNEGTLDALRETVLRRLDEVDSSHPGEKTDANEHFSIVPHLGTKPRDLVLTAEELEQSEQEVEEMATALDDFALVLLELLGAGDGSVDFGSELALSMAAVVESYLGAGNVDGLCSFLERVQALESSDRCAAGTLWRLVTESISDKLADLMRATEGTPAQRAKVEELLRLACICDSSPLLELLAESEDRNLRKTLLGVLQKGDGVPVSKLMPLLADPRWYVVRNALQLAAVTRDPALIPLVQRLLTHEDARVRREAVRALEVLAGPTALSALTGALADPDSAVRTVAARGSLRQGGVEQETAVLRQIKSRDFAGRPAEEVEALLVALAALAGERAVPLLTKLRRRRLLHPAPLPLRLAALGALGTVPGASARKVLMSASRSRKPTVRQAAKRALLYRGP